MNSKERVLEAIALREPDRTPVDLWALPPVTQQLISRLGVENNDEVWKALSVDIRSIWPDYIGPEREVFSDGSWRDWWGIRKRMVGSFEEVTEYPLAGYATVGEIERYLWPDPDWFDYKGLVQQCRRFEEYALVIRDPGPYTTCVLRVAMYLRSMDRFMMDLILNPEIARAILVHVARFYLEMNRRILEAVGKLTDICCIADDLGMQEGLLISPEMFDGFIRPHLAQFIDLAKKYNQRVMYHSCGAIRPLIAKFVDLGIDILNPIQLSAQGMDAAELKIEFGRTLCFHGALDVQSALYRGTPEAIRDEVARLCRVLGAEGGYILAPTNNILPGTPMENILAAYQAARDGR